MNTTDGLPARRKGLQRGSRLVEGRQQGVRDTVCTARALVLRDAGREGSTRRRQPRELRLRGKQGLEEREAAASALTREGAAPGRALGCPHARCQLHAGRCPDAFASPCSSPACLWATARPHAAAEKGKARLGHAGTGQAGEHLPMPIALPRAGARGSRGSGSSHPSFGRWLRRQWQSTAWQSYGCAEIQRWEVPRCSLCSVLS